MEELVFFLKEQHPTNNRLHDLSTLDKELSLDLKSEIFDKKNVTPDMTRKYSNKVLELLKTIYGKLRVEEIIERNNDLLISFVYGDNTFKDSGVTLPSCVGKDRVTFYGEAGLFHLSITKEPKFLMLSKAKLDADYIFGKLVAADRCHEC